MGDRTRMTIVTLIAGLGAMLFVSGHALAADDFFSSRGVRIRYVSEGRGEAVVLIHGWMADSSMWGRDLLGNTKLDTRNADGFQFIALDCRGHGKSDKPHDAIQYDAEVAADVVRLLDHLKIEKAHLVGYSSGAFIAGKVAATHPDRVLSLVFAAQAPILGAVKDSDFTEVETFARLVDEGKDLGAYFLAVMPPDRKAHMTEAQAATLARLFFAGKDVKALAAAGRGFKTLAVSVDELNRCKAPVLWMHGGNESEYIQKRVAAARQLLGRGDLKVIEGGDHITTLAKPEFRSTLLQFLKQGNLK